MQPATNRLLRSPADAGPANAGPLAGGRPEPRPAAPARPGLLARLALLAVALPILHGFCLFAVAQVARIHPTLLTDHDGVALLLCGEGAGLTLHFSRPGPHQARGLDRWIECRDDAGRIVEGAGQIAAHLAALVLSAPLGMILFGRAMRAGRRPRPRMPERRGTAWPGWARWRARLVLSAATLAVAAVVAGAAGAYAMRHQAQTLGGSTLAGRLLCGDEALRAQVVNPRSRARRLACFDGDGAEQAGPTPPLLRLILPVFLLVAAPGLVLALRIRLEQRRVRVVRRM